MSSPRPLAAVVVLGDIGRSPRMCYHAYSLANTAGYDVTMIGYLDTRPHKTIDEHPHIRIEALSPPSEKLLNRLPQSAHLPMKFLWTFVVLTWCLLFRVGFALKLVLMQNPPAIPTMFSCWLVSRLKGAKFVIDWHNYMWSVLKNKYELTENLTLPRLDDDGSDGKDSQKSREVKKKLPLKDKFGNNIRPKKHGTEKDKKKPPISWQRYFVEKVYCFEGRLGRCADAGLCVTQAMRDDLQKAWGVNSAVFYDRPPSWQFSPVSLHDIHDLFERLSLKPGGRVFKARDGSNAFTHRASSGEISLRGNRPMIIISSTSWTPDEDFSILLEAIIQYNDIAHLTKSSAPPHRLPHVLLIITGRGPDKEKYVAKMEKLHLENVDFLTPWLEAEDYPKLLAAADLGVSLHTSTSALDLPMKVVDMFGSGLPVLAKKFACIGELVVDGKNGKLFDTATELSHLIRNIATGYPAHAQELKELKNSVLTEGLSSWEETWTTTVLPIVKVESDQHAIRILAKEPNPEDTQ